MAAAEASRRPLTKRQVLNLRRWARMRSRAFQAERARGMFVASQDQILAWLKRYEPVLHALLIESGCPRRCLIAGDTLRLTRNLGGDDPRTGRLVVQVVTDVTFTATGVFEFFVLWKGSAPPTEDMNPEHQQGRRAN